MNCRAIILAALLAAAPGCAWAALPNAPITEVRAGEATAEMYVSLAKGQLLHVDRPFRRVSVGTRDIADVMAMQGGMIYVVGKKAGSTNLTLRDANGAVVVVIDVIVTGYDITGLTHRLQRVMPGEDLEVAPSGEGIALSGQVSSADHLRQALAIAELFAPGKIANLLTVGGSQQVLLEVKFAEVERTALKDLGVTTQFNYAAGGDAIASAIGTGTAATPFGSIAGVFNHGNYSLTARLDALQKAGVIRTLAEPNLVALSGDTASFLAGGEIPIPVAVNPSGFSGYPQVSLDYKQYGVGLSFTPTVVGHDLVNLVLNSEVSSIDNTNAFRDNGFNIPALKVRRAKTTVELRDGESFAVAGLLQDDFVNGTQGFPGLGDVPVLGALFRSVNYQHAQSDLVMIVTVHLIAPTVAKNLSTPLDGLVLPTPGEQILNGNVEDKGAKPEQPKTKDNQGFVLP